MVKHMAEIDAVSETLCFLVLRIPDAGQHPESLILSVIHHRHNPSDSTNEKYYI
jgi:hypothetical protein